MNSLEIFTQPFLHQKRQTEASDKLAFTAPQSMHVGKSSAAATQVLAVSVHHVWKAVIAFVIEARLKCSFITYGHFSRLVHWYLPFIWIVNTASGFALSCLRQLYHRLCEFLVFHSSKLGIEEFGLLAIFTNNWGRFYLNELSPSVHISGHKEVCTKRYSYLVVSNNYTPIQGTYKVHSSYAVPVPSQIHA